MLVCTYTLKYNKIRLKAYQILKSRVKLFFSKQTIANVVAAVGFEAMVLKKVTQLNCARFSVLMTGNYNDV